MAEAPAFHSPQTAADGIDVSLGWVKQDPDLWFEDGSIVVVAENTGFCVHKLLLSHLSPVLRDVFAVSQPIAVDSSRNVVGNVPVVHVSDSVYDMRCLLRAIYDGRGYVPLPSPPTSTASSFELTARYLRDMSPYVPFALISALMRLGHKYKLKDIVDDAAQRLEDYFTTDFGTWLQYCSGDACTTFDFSDDEEGADIFEAVNLARLTRKFSILPLALYKCCQYDLAEIMFGIERGASGDVVYLGQDDVERCVRARERLLRESCQMAQTIGSATSSPHCEAPHVCPRQPESLHKTSTSMLAGLINTDALSGFREQLGMVTGFVQCMELCYECWEGLAYQHELKQRETWGKLLDILDLADEDLGIEWAGTGPSWDI